MNPLPPWFTEAWVLVVQPTPRSRVRYPAVALGQSAGALWRAREEAQLTMPVAKHEHIRACMERYQRWVSKQLQRTRWIDQPHMAECYAQRAAWIAARQDYLEEEYRKAYAILARELKGDD